MTVPFMSRPERSTSLKSSLETLDLRIHYSRVKIHTRLINCKLSCYTSCSYYTDVPLVVKVHSVSGPRVVNSSVVLESLVVFTIKYVIKIYF